MIWSKQFDSPYRSRFLPGPGWSRKGDKPRNGRNELLQGRAEITSQAPALANPDDGSTSAFTREF